MATEADLIQKFKDLNIPVGADFEELIHAAFASSNLADLVNSYDSRIATVETDLATKADDSKVVHDNHDGTEQLNGVKVQPYNKLSDTIGGRNLLINTAQLNDSTVCLDTKSNISDTYLGLNIYQTNAQWSGVRIYLSYLAPKIKTNTDYVMSEYVRNTSSTTSADIFMFANDNTGAVFNSALNYIPVTLPPNSGWTRISALVNIASFSTTISGSVRFENGTTLTDGYVQFAGLKLEQGSVATDWSPAPEDKVNVADMRTPASNVAGIDEVNAKQDKIGYTPADDSKVAHLSGANNFDTVPMVKNNPLLLASSLPSDLARTSQQTNFTNGLQSGGVNVATAADLKSLEDASWHEVDLPDTSVLKQAHFMYRSEPIDTHYNTSFTLTGTVYVPAVNSSTGVILLDLSSYLPISKADYKNYTVNSTILGPTDNSFIVSNYSSFNPNYYIGANSIEVKLIDSNLVLYNSSTSYTYFKTSLSTGATIALVTNSGSNSLPTIDFVSSTKS